MSSKQGTGASQGSKRKADLISSDGKKQEPAPEGGREGKARKGSKVVASPKAGSTDPCEAGERAPKRGKCSPSNQNPGKAGKKEGKSSLAKPSAKAKELPAKYKIDQAVLVHSMKWNQLYDAKVMLGLRNFRSNTPIQLL